MCSSESQVAIYQAPRFRDVRPHSEVMYRYVIRMCNMTVRVCCRYAPVLCMKASVLHVLHTVCVICVFSLLYHMCHIFINIIYFN
jgi:hypothetical protein